MYRNEHPNPQFKRDSYECLNGSWGFEKGKYEDLCGRAPKDTIEVPF